MQRAETFSARENATSALTIPGRRSQFLKTLHTTIINIDSSTSVALEEIHQKFQGPAVIIFVRKTKKILRFPAEDVQIVFQIDIFLFLAIYFVAVTVFPKSLNTSIYAMTHVNVVNTRVN